jgi:curved DNA-binding protein CbpA
MNFYNILNSNINDSQKDIKKKYYKLCKKYHPDKNYNNQSDHIKKINLAYEVLGDSEKRNKYNKFILKNQKSNLDYLNMLFLFYKTVSNNILQILLKKTILSYLTITQTINVKFEDFYNNNNHKVTIITKNYNNHNDSNHEIVFTLNDTNKFFHKKGDIYESFQGDINININIDYSNYLQFQIVNDKLFCECTKKTQFIELPNNDILDIANVKWDHSKIGTICTIPNYGLFINKYRRDYLTLYKN